jgi:hypothetical protein
MDWQKFGRFLKTLLSYVKRLSALLARKLWIWTRRNPQLAITTYLVIIAHGIGIYSLSYEPIQVTKIGRPKPLAVQTIQLTKPKPKPKPPENKSVAPKPVAKKEVKQKPTPKKKPVAKKKAPEKAVDSKLLSKALASLDKVSTEKKANTNKSVMPISLLQIDSKGNQTNEPMNPKHLGYCEELVRRLQLLLRLPEYGEVRIALTLNRDGSVANLNVLSAQSKVNRTYAETTIPKHSYPHFGTNFEGEKQHQFVLALSND